MVQAEDKGAFHIRQMFQAGDFFHALSERGDDQAAEEPGERLAGQVGQGLPENGEPAPGPRDAAPARR